MNAQRGEWIGIVSILLGFAAAPAFCHFYESHREARAVAAAPKAGKLHVYHLTGLAKPGMWTLDAVEGWNYWWRKPRRLNEIAVNKGDTVLITLASADVEHGFTIPALGIGHIEVKPGHLKTISFVADRAGSFPFLCAKVCSCTGTGFACTLTKKQGHEGMTGILTVTEPLGPPDVSVAVTVSEEKGFDPPVIRVHQGDVVEVTVTSRSKGIGNGVGFCISEYETKVDLQGIGPGETRKFKFRADRAGSFTIYSSTQAGDRIDSANGSFIVAAAPAPRHL
jgi:heme/copper-type cytochrome/quinol oxidase subunit 2